MHSSSPEDDVWISIPVLGFGDSLLEKYPNFVVRSDVKTLVIRIGTEAMVRILCPCYHDVLVRCKVGGVDDAINLSVGQRLSPFVDCNNSIGDNSEAIAVISSITAGSKIENGTAMDALFGENGLNGILYSEVEARKFYLCCILDPKGPIFLSVCFGTSCTQNNEAHEGDYCADEPKNTPNSEVPT
jgi:hypothetical protein